MLSPSVRSGTILLVYAVWTSVVLSAYYVVPDASSIGTSAVVVGGPYAADAIRAALRAVTGAAAVLLACVALGTLLTTRITLPTDNYVQRGSYVLAIGFIGLSIVSQTLAYAGVYTAPIVRSGVLLFAIIGAMIVLRRRHFLPRAVPSQANLPFVLLTLIALATACVAALAPESEYDALWYHLWLPQRWLDAGRPVDIIEEYISLYPLSWDLAYGAALTVGGAGAAKLLHFVCLPLVAIGSWLLCREIAPRANAWVAVALTVTTPTLLWEATTAYVDLALSWYVALAVLAAIRYHRSSDRRWLSLAGLMLGGALAIKHLALVVALVLGTTLFIAQIRRHAMATVFRRMALFTIVALAVPAPWYVRAYVASGNPVFPDLYGVFGATPAERWSPLTERGLAHFKSQFGRERTVRNLALLPWDVTVHGARYGGSLGPLFLILLPAGIIASRRSASRFIVLGLSAFVAIWASPVSSFQLRFLLPAIPLLALLGAVGFERIRATAASVVPGGAHVVMGTLALLLTMNLPMFVEWHDRERHHGGPWLTHVIREVPVAAVTGAESRSAYLRRLVPSFAAWEFIDQHLPPDSRVLTFSGGDHLYSGRSRLWSDATMARPVAWGAVTGTERETVQRLHDMGITHVLLDERQLAAESSVSLAIASEAMRACCLSEIYRDRRYSLQALVAVDGPSRPKERHRAERAMHSKLEPLQ